MQKIHLRGQVCLIGAPVDLRALLVYGEIAQRSQEGNPAPEVVTRTPSVLEMLVAGGKGECGRDTAAVGKTFSVNKTGEAAGEQNERTLTPYFEGVGGKNLRFKTKRGGGLTIVAEPEGTGKRTKCQGPDANAKCQETVSEQEAAELRRWKKSAKTPALVQTPCWERRGYRLFSTC